MFTLSSAHQFFFYSQPTDMRKSFDALSGIVREQMHRNPTSGEVFIFVNKTRNRIKLLHWETDGFTLYYKRLEKGTLELPDCTQNTNSIAISWSDLVMITQGISLKNVRKKKRFLFQN
jgi:transposase